MKSKIAYLIILGLILYPLAQHWQEPVKIPKKQALLPPLLPNIPKANGKLLNIVLKHNLWDKKRQQLSLNDDKISKKSKTEQKNIKWQLQAVAPQEIEASIIIAINSQPRLFHLGDKLPGGWQLIKILTDGIVIKQQKTTKYVYLFGKS